jgi:hypothetical protein
MMTESLGPNGSPYYSKVVYSGSVGEDDETYETFKKALKTHIIQVPPNKLMEFLNEHLRVKKKYNAIYKYIMNDFKEPNKTMQKILDKHKTQFFGSRKIRNNKRVNTTVDCNKNDDSRNYPKKQIAIYALNKIIKYKCNKIPAYLFIALDDAASSELKSKNDSPIIRLALSKYKRNKDKKKNKRITNDLYEEYEEKTPQTTAESTQQPKPVITDDNFESKLKGIIEEPDIEENNDKQQDKSNIQQ